MDSAEEGICDLPSKACCGARDSRFFNCRSGVLVELFIVNYLLKKLLGEWYRPVES